LKHSFSFKTKLFSRVVALTTDVSMDFSLSQSAPYLTTEQKNFLFRQSKEKIDKIINIRQVHGARVIVVKKDMTRMPQADALITDQPGVALAVRTADCLPVFFAEPRHPAIGLIHAGWKSTRQKIVVKTLQAMQQHYKIDLSRLKVVLGPGLRQCCFEVGPEFQGFFPFSVIARGHKYFFDSIKENTRLLIEAGVLEENIFDSGRCTMCDKDFFSHRRQGPLAGRMLSVLMLKNKKS
jgi:polyphenol oxidase